MDFRTVIIIVLSVLLAAVLSLVAVQYLDDQHRKNAALSLLPAMENYQVQSETRLLSENVRLYFLSKDHSQLEVEKRIVSISSTLDDKISKAMTELIAGPRAGNLLSPIPKGTTLQSVFFSEADRSLYVSFSEELITNHPGHALAEWATIYAIVNTAGDLSPVIREVQILINGQPVSDSQTVMDWSLPFAPDYQAFVRHTIAEPAVAGG